MGLLIGLESQPKFPREDLTETNAELLELMLANAGIVHDMHLAAERITPLYRLGHPAMRHAGQRVAVLEPRADAFNHGVTTYEAIAALVRHTPSTVAPFVANINAAAIGSGLEEHDLLEYIEGAEERLVTRCHEQQEW